MQGVKISQIVSYSDTSIPKREFSDLFIILAPSESLKFLSEFRKHKKQNWIYFEEVGQNKPESSSQRWTVGSSQTSFEGEKQNSHLNLFAFSIARLACFLAGAEGGERQFGWWCCYCRRETSAPNLIKCFVGRKFKRRNSKLTGDISFESLFESQ